MTRAEYKAARRAFRAFERMRVNHERDQLMADQRQLFRELPPMHYWLMATFEPKRGDALFTAHRSRPIRAERLRLSRACRAGTAARNEIGRASFSQPFRAVIDKISREWAQPPEAA